MAKEKKTKAEKLQTPRGGASGFLTRVWNFLVLGWIGMGMNFKEIFTFHKQFDLKKVPRRPGEVAVITGGGRGIGFEVVKKLLILDMQVVIGVRNPAACQKAVDKLRKGGIATGAVDIVELDLTSLESVRSFASKVSLKYQKIHVLINNGGIMLTPYNITVDGNESQFQVNYLSHFLLTNLLLPKLIRAGRAGKASRIVNVSSAAHLGGKINFEDVNQTKMYCKTMGYMASKLMQVVNTKDLNGRLEKEGVHVKVYAVHPGVVYTDLYNHLLLARLFGCIFRLLYKSPEQGADGVVFAAISSKFEGEGGHYFANCKKNRVNPVAKRDDVQKKLWELSCILSEWNDVSFSDIVKQIMITARITGGEGGNKEDNLQKSTSISANGQKDALEEEQNHSEHRKLERQPKIEVEEKVAKNVQKSEQQVLEKNSAQPEISNVKLSTSTSTSTPQPPSQKSSITSTSTIMGGSSGDQVSVVIIPPTEASSSETEGDDASLGGYGVKSAPDEDQEHGNKVTITEITSEEEGAINKDS